MTGRPEWWQQRRFRAMGTTVHVLAGGGPGQALDWAESEMARLELSWTRFRPDSELSRVNAAGGAPVRISPDLALALDRAAVLWGVTDGAFDPTILAALERAGYDRSFELLPVDGPAPLDAARPAPGFAGVELDLARSVVRLPAGTRLDLGGVGKGLAADLVAEGLVARGASSALVSVGGDLRAAGAAPEGGWRIPVEHPTDPARRLFDHVLDAGGLVQSTCAIRRWRRGGRWLHHLLDPHTGEPAGTDVAGAVVAASEAWFAEGVAKAAVVLGADAGAELMERVGVDGWLVDHDGELLAAVDGRATCSRR